MKYSIFLLVFVFLFSHSAFSGSFDLDKLCDEMYKIYDSDELPAKKENLAYKKLNGLIGTNVTVKITTTDSITYDRKEDKTTLKSKEVFTSDNKTGYFGVFVMAAQKGDNLLMSTSPGKDMTITGTITDVLVVGYIKDNLNGKAYTSIKDFDDKGTIIQQIIIKVDM
ncbi:MAG TPA: hypothetical protein PK753_12055 [Ignavibacteria bacterium]|nr:hypothetical protein [Ignavibacteria bacterium]